VPFREAVYRWGRRVSPMDETNRVLPRLPDARQFFCAAESWKPVNRRDWSRASAVISDAIHIYVRNSGAPCWVRGG
jgi:hypothetical protein